MGGMPLGPPLAAFVVVVMTVVTSAVIVSDPEPFSSGPATMAAATLILLGLVAVAGMLLARGRWARWLLCGLGLSHLGLIAASGVTWPLVAVAGAALAVELGAAGPGARGWVRRLPSADGPPPLAALLLVGAVAFPLVISVANADGISPWAVGGGAVVVMGAAVYSRSGVSALWGVRALIPVEVAAAALATPLPWALPVAVSGAALIVITWAPTVRQAAVPLTPLRSPGYKIPPQLTPQEILDAAGLDSEGRRR